MGNGMQMPAKFLVHPQIPLLARGPDLQGLLGSSRVLQGVSTADPGIPQPAESVRHTHSVPTATGQASGEPTASA